MRIFIIIIIISIVFDIYLLTVGLSKLKSQLSSTNTAKKLKYTVEIDTKNVPNGE